MVSGTDFPTQDEIAEDITVVVDGEYIGEVRYLAASVKGDIRVTLEDEFGNITEYRWVKED